MAVVNSRMSIVYSSDGWRIHQGGGPGIQELSPQVPATSEVGSHSRVVFRGEALRTASEGAEEAHGSRLPCSINSCAVAAASAAKADARLKPERKHLLRTSSSGDSRVGFDTRSYFSWYGRSPVFHPRVCSPFFSKQRRHIMERDDRSPPLV